MAEGLARKLFGDKVEVQSAGSQPSGKVNPLAIQVMQEIGIDISKHYSKSWDDLPPRFFIGLDYVISLCAEEVCPNIASKSNKLRWPIEDPARSLLSPEESLQEFRKARDEIQIKLKEMLPVIT